MFLQSGCRERISSGFSQGLSEISMKTYSPSFGADGQYMSCAGRKEHWSNISSPISAAAYLETAAYSSAVISLKSGTMTRTLGLSGVWLCVE